jgi:hypothetical protein
LPTTRPLPQQIIPKPNLKPMKQDKNGITSKWLITGIDGFCFGSDGNLYKFPFRSGKNYYGLNRISEDRKNRRYRINGIWWSKKQLQGKLYLNPKPEVIIKPEKDCPF